MLRKLGLGILIMSLLLVPTLALAQTKGQKPYDGQSGRPEKQEEIQVQRPTQNINPTKDARTADLPVVPELTGQPSAAAKTEADAPIDDQYAQYLAIPGASAGAAVFVSYESDLDLIGNAYAPDGEPDVLIRAIMHEPDNKLVEIRLENIGGERGSWYSPQIPDSLPLGVVLNGALVNAEDGSLRLNAFLTGQEPVVFDLVLKKNDTLGGETRFRLTMLFEDGTRRYAVVNHIPAEQTATPDIRDDIQ